MAANLTQTNYRIRSDTTAFNPGTPVWVTTQDQATSLLWPEARTFRIRFVIQNTGTSGSGNSGWNIAFSRNGGAFTLATTTGTIVKLDSTASSDAGSITLTTHLLSGGLGTAANGIATDDTNTTANLNLAASTHAEFEFGLSIPKGVILDGDTLDFHAFHNGSALNAYSITPRIVVAVDDGFGSAQGDATAAAVGQAGIAAAGLASGDANASAVANFNEPMVGAAQGDSTAAATGTGFSLGDGLAQGDAVASAVGSGLTPALTIGFAEGEALALASGNASIGTIGLASGDAIASGVSGGASFGAAIGDAVASAQSSFFTRRHRVWHSATRIGVARSRDRTEIY